MLENNTGHIVGVNGNMLTVEFETAVTRMKLRSRCSATSGSKPKSFA